MQCAWVARQQTAHHQAKSATGKEDAADSVAVPVDPVTAADKLDQWCQRLAKDGAEAAHGTARVCFLSTHA